MNLDLECYIEQYYFVALKAQGFKVDLYCNAVNWAFYQMLSYSSQNIFTPRIHLYLLASWIFYRLPVLPFSDMELTVS